VCNYYQNSITRLIYDTQIQGQAAIQSGIFATGESKGATN
jgi:hypothetical protein